jgi:hypothetical protein
VVLVVSDFESLHNLLYAVNVVLNILIVFVDRLVRFVVVPLDVEAIEQDYLVAAVVDLVAFVEAAELVVIEIVEVQYFYLECD